MPRAQKFITDAIRGMEIKVEELIQIDLESFDPITPRTRSYAEVLLEDLNTCTKAMMEEKEKEEAKEKGKGKAR